MNDTLFFSTDNVVMAEPDILHVSALFANFVCLSLMSSIEQVAWRKPLDLLHAIHDELTDLWKPLLEEEEQNRG